jgi:hypothetical protein
MSLRKITVFLPDPDEAVVIDGVPACVTGFSLKKRLLELANLNLGIPSDFEIAADGICYGDDEPVDSDEIYIVTGKEREEKPRIDAVLKIVFWCVHVLPIYCLVKQRPIWQIVGSNILAMLVFNVLKLARERHWESWLSERFVPSHNLAADLWSLFMKSLLPSFRVEHLISGNE